MKLRKNPFIGHMCSKWGAGLKFTLVWRQYTLVCCTPIFYHFSLSYKNVFRPFLCFSSTYPTSCPIFHSFLKNQLNMHCFRKRTLTFPVSSAFITLCFCFILPTSMMMQNQISFIMTPRTLLFLFL